MPALAFFPWLTLSGPYKIGRYVLIPRQKGAHPFGMNPDDQKIIDDVFEPYHDERGPVEGGIIAGVDDAIGFEDVNDEQSSDLFSFAQIIKCSGLSARRFFDHLSYYNADNFVFIIQKFVPGEKGAAVTTKRRDGTTQTYFSGTTFREYCPKHAKPSQKCMMDADLAVGLLKARDAGKEWDALSDAIFYYCLANTDNQQIPQQQEAVMLVGALQRILGCTSAKCDDLVKALEEVLVPTTALDINQVDRLKGTRYEGKSGSVRGAWIADFYHIRGDLAHGKQESKKQLAWSLHEHLLFATFLFPLLLKIRLHNSGMYELNDWDKHQIDSFEALLTIRPLDNLSGDFSETPPWHEILRDPDYFLPKMAIREMLKQMVASEVHVDEGSDPE